MPDVVINALVNAGLLGPVLIAVGLYVLRRDRDHAEAMKDAQKKLDEANSRTISATLDAHSKRVEDAQRVAGALLEREDKWQRIIQDSSHAAAETNNSLERVRETLDKVWERLHLPRS